LKFKKLKLSGLVLITPDIFADSRGFFMESYNKKVFFQNGITVNFVQDNHSFSQKNVLRGLHFQKPPFAQDKLVSVIRGRVLDVAVDIRPDSPTFGKWQAVTLSAKNHRLFFIPKGFAHGFLALSSHVDFVYKCSELYHPEADAGLRWNDPKIGINWSVKNPIISDKDKIQPLLSQIKTTLS